ncbi:helix-turn-helix transcriptional regulator, partial [Streptomyces sp. ID05-47C]
PADRPPTPREPLWRDLVGDVLRRERQAQERTLKDVADTARISMPYLSEVERGRKEASSEVLAAAARALGLSLGDLLARAQGELVRLTSRTSRTTQTSHAGSTATTSSYNGLCLAA